MIKTDNGKLTPFSLWYLDALRDADRITCEVLNIKSGLLWHRPSRYTTKFIYHHKPSRPATIAEIIKGFFTK